MGAAARNFTQFPHWITRSVDSNVFIVGVHVRRGIDIRMNERNKRHGHVAAPLEYFKQAMKAAIEDQEEYLYVICSDDIAWAKKTFKEKDYGKNIAKIKRNSSRKCSFLSFPVAGSRHGCFITSRRAGSLNGHLLLVDGLFISKCWKSSIFYSYFIYFYIRFIITMAGQSQEVSWIEW